MGRQFSPSEVDAMVQAAESLKTDARLAAKKIQPCNFRQAGQPSGEQVRTLNALHEVFAKNLSASLASQLRTGFEVTLGGIELVAFSEFVSKIASSAYLATLDLPKLESTALLHIEHAVLFPTLDILMGGTGLAETPARELTEIEREVIQDLTKTVCRELEATWQHLGLSVSFGQHLSFAECQELMPLREKALTLTFEVAVAESKGKIELVVPGAVSNILLRKMSKDSLNSKSKTHRTDDRLRNKLLNCTFNTELAIPNVKADLQELLGLASGNVLNLRIPLRSPATLLVAGSETFESNPVRSGKSRAAQIRRRLDFVNQEKRD